MSTPTGTSTCCRHYISLWSNQKKKKIGDTRNHQNLPPTRGVGSLYSFQGCLLPYTNIGTVQEISEISCTGSDIPVQGTAIWFVHSTHGVHCSSKGGELMAIHKDIRIHQYLDDWLVKAKSHQVCLQHTQDLVKMCQQLGWLVNLDKSELEHKQVFNFRLPVRPQVRSVPTYTGPVAKPSRETTETAIPTGLSGPGIHALYRFINTHRKTSSRK